jgi:hypothetical protein
MVALLIVSAYAPDVTYTFSSVDAVLIEQVPDVRLISRRLLPESPNARALRFTTVPAADPVITIFPVPKAIVLLKVLVLLKTGVRRLKLAKLIVPASKAIFRLVPTAKSEASVHVAVELLNNTLHPSTTPLVSIVNEPVPPKVMADVEDHTAVAVRVNA